MAQIGKSLKLKGEITGSEDLYIDGEVEGTVELKGNSLTVGPNGNVHADVKGGVNLDHFGGAKVDQLVKG